MQEPSTPVSSVSPPPLVEYRTPVPPAGPLARSRARPLAWLFAIDIGLAAGFVIFSYVHEVMKASKWTHRDDSSLAVLLAIVAVLEAVPLSFSMLRLRGARLLGLIFAAAHMAVCGMLGVSLWLALMFAPISPGTVGWAGLYTVAAQGLCNIVLMALLYGEVVHPDKRG